MYALMQVRMHYVFMYLCKKPNNLCVLNTLKYIQGGKITYKEVR